jgi:hypothetical protein
MRSGCTTTSLLSPILIFVESSHPFALSQPVPTAFASLHCQAFSEPFPAALSDPFPAVLPKPFTTVFVEPFPAAFSDPFPAVLPKHSFFSRHFRPSAPFHVPAFADPFPSRRFDCTLLIPWRLCLHMTTSWDDP